MKTKTNIPIEDHFRKVDASLEDIIKQECPNITTLELRGRDSLDFHDVHVGRLMDIARRAYLAGHTAGKRETS